MPKMIFNRFMTCLNLSLLVNFGTCSTTEEGKCVCPANIEECATADKKGHTCTHCVVVQNGSSLLNDGRKDCLYGTDESPDAKMIQLSANHDLVKHLFWRGEWRCRSKNDTNRVQHCDREREDVPFLFLVSYKYTLDLPQNFVCNNFGEAMKFWQCGLGNKCVREGLVCMVAKDSCPPGLSASSPYFEDRGSYCVQKICPKDHWPCHGSCIGIEEPCGTICAPDLQYCPGTGQYGNSPRCISNSQTCFLGLLEKELCFENRWYCAKDDQCIDKEEPCDQNCKPGMTLCMNKGTATCQVDPCVIVERKQSLHYIYLTTIGVLVAIIVFLLVSVPSILIIRSRQKVPIVTKTEDAEESGIDLQELNHEYSAYVEDGKEDYVTVDPTYHYYTLASMHKSIRKIGSRTDKV